MEYETLNYASVFSGYQKPPATEASPFYHTDLKGSLENIVFNEEPESEKSIVGRIFSDKGKTLKATIKALFNEIQLREKLDTFLVYRVDEEIQGQKSELLHLKGLRVHYTPELYKDVTKSKRQLEDSLSELEREKRKEYVECWRDLMFMKKYLLTALKDYWDLSKKRNVLAYDFNKFVENENPKGC